MLMCFFLNKRFDDDDEYDEQRYRFLDFYCSVEIFCILQQTIVPWLVVKQWRSHGSLTCTDRFIESQAVVFGIGTLSQNRNDVGRFYLACLQGDFLKGKK